MGNANPLLRNLIAGLLMAGVGVWIWVHTRTFPSLQEGYPGPALFPRLIAIGLVLSGGVFVGRSLRRWNQLRQMASVPRPDWFGLGRVGLGLLLVVLYPLLQTWLGFIPTVSVISFAIACALRARLIVALSTALLSTLAIYWVFTGLLGVPL